MRLTASIALIVCLLTTRSAWGVPADDLFQNARVVPADVDLYVQVENAAAVRRELADRPIARWTHSLLEISSFRAAWSSAAKAAQTSDDQLFDLLLGRSFTLVTRSPQQWAVLATVDQKQGTDLLSRMRVRVLTPRHGVAIAELPEQEMLIGRDGDRMLIGGSKNPALFYDCLPRLVAQGDANTLAAQPCLKDMAALGGGTAGVFLRHAKPLGGHSVAVAQLKGDALTLHNLSHFEAAPFGHAATKLTCDFSPILGFRDNALLAVIQPMDAGDDALDAFLNANLGQGLVSKSMRENLKDRRMLVLGEKNVHDAAANADYLSPTLVSCLEIKDQAAAVEQLDEQMLQLTRRLSRMGEGSMLQPLQPPSVRSMQPSQPREVDLQPLFHGGFPVMNSVALTWTVSTGEGGSWFLVGSDRRWLDDVVKVLHSRPAADKRLVGAFDSCGVGNGMRISRHLQTWSNQAALLAEPDHADDLKSALGMMADLAGGMRRCDWRLARPGENQMKLDVQIELAPPESVRQP